MKRTLWIITCCFVAQLATAQAPKWAEKARKAVFSIVTYDKENKIKGTGNGFYIDAQGTALSDYTLFEGADRAVIINADGKQLDVNRILGANSIYDVVKFNTPMEKKQVTLSIATQPAKVNEIVYLLPYSTQKATTIQTARVTAVDSIGSNSFYYTLEMKTNDKLVSCPIMNNAGQVLGLIQKNADSESTESYAIGAGYGAALNISGLSVSDQTLNRIGIRKALPNNEEQALVYLYMSTEQMDEKGYMALLEDFIQAYPNNHEGYIRRANARIYSNHAEQYPMATKDLEDAIKIANNKNEASYQAAKAIYAYQVSLAGKEAYKEWSYDKALETIRQAIESDPQPVYTQLEGDILFAQGKYAEAFTCYEKVNQSPIADASTFYSSAKTKQLIEGSDMNEVIALMDSAIVKLKKPYFAEAAPYFYERANMLNEAGKYRDAVKDYNTFYDAISGEVTALFFYQRAQAEMQCRMFQQGLDDINRAVEMEPEDMDYLLEKGSIHLRVNQLAEAESAFLKVLDKDDKNAVAYRLLGYSLALQKKTKEACAYFDKAKELGDELVDKLIEKYCK